MPGARFLALLVHPAAVFTPAVRAGVVSSFRLGARKAILGFSAVSPSAAAVSLRREQGLHQVGSGHRLELSTCGLAGFADVDRLCQRQIAHLQQLVSSGLVADANDDSVADHRLHDGAELTRSSHPWLIKVIAG